MKDIKQKIAVDSCVFLNMLGYNDHLKANGKQATLKEMKDDKENLINEEIRLNNVIDKINSLLNQVKYLDVNQKNHFNNDVEMNMKIEPTSKSLRACIENVKENIETKQNTLAKITSPVGKERVSNIIENDKKLLAELTDLEATFADLKKNYNTLKNKVNVSEICRKFFNNEIEIYIPSEVAKEIVNHIKQNPNRTGNVNEESLVELKSVNNLLTSCNPIKINSNQYDALCSQLTTILINSGAMKEETNSVKNDENNAPNGEYGDATIMAECNLLGLQLVTQNRKDFIYDKNKDIVNNKIVGDSRRQAMKVIFGMNNYCTDMLPCSVAEFESDNYHHITKQTNLSKEFGKQEKTNFAELEF